MFSFFFWLHHVTCGILVLWPGIEPGSSAAERAQSLTAVVPGEIPFFFF